MALLQASASSRPQLSVPIGHRSLYAPFTFERWPCEPLSLLEPVWPLQPVFLVAPPLPTPRESVLLRNSSRFRGVVWDVASQAWRAKIKLKGKSWYLGTHKDEAVAARAYDSASWFMNGPKGKLNFSKIDYDVLGPPRAPPLWVLNHLVQVVGCHWVACVYV
jgi:hypothetical protein